MNDFRLLFFYNFLFFFSFVSQTKEGLNDEDIYETIDTYVKPAPVSASAPASAAPQVGLAVPDSGMNAFVQDVNNDVIFSSGGKGTSADPSLFPVN